MFYDDDDDDDGRCRRSVLSVYHTFTELHENRKIGDNEACSVLWV